YIALIGGSTFGLSGDGNHPNLNHPTIVDIMENTSKTWKAFAEDASGTGCGLNPPRGEDHFPFLSFTTITGNASRCANLLPGSSNEVISAFNAGTNFIWLTPNDCNNMHSCSVAHGDAWIASWVPALLAAMAGKKAALLITFDEGYTTPPYIYTAFIGTAANLAYKSSAAYSHYSFSKLLEDVWGGGNLGQNDVTAPSPVEFFQPGGPDFGISANPTSVSFGTGQSASSTISLSSTGGFASTVNLTSVSVPTGITTSCVPSTLTGNGTSTCTLTANKTGPYAVTITGTSGNLIHNASFDVTVTPAPQPDFSLDANPSALSLTAGDSGSTTISLQSTGGFAGTVDLTTASSPDGLTISCARSSITGSQTSTCTLGSSTAGSYAVTITGTSGNLVHTASVSVEVTPPVVLPDFSLAADPAAVSFNAGESDSSTISVMATGDFSATVGLTATSDPAGVTTVCSPTSIPGSGTAICVLSGRTPGLFKVDVTGTSGSLTRSVPILVTLFPGEPKIDTIPPQIAITLPSNSTVLPYANVT